jgi:phosphoribosylanthranilate isomerase
MNKGHSMFRVKICGITSVDDARAVAAAGADAVGLNFYAKSPRYVSVEKAREIVNALPAQMVKVGLFVNAPAEEVCQTYDALGLDLIQLHGDEPPHYLADLGGRAVMRAFRFGPGGLRSPQLLDHGQPVSRTPRVPDALESMARYLGHCGRLGCMPRLVLVDAYVEGEYGGTGQAADWERLKGSPFGTSAPPLVLAGGLTPDNVAEAVRTVGPAAVDTASGVESSPGRKDPAAVEAFVRAARRAFDEF